MATKITESKTDIAYRLMLKKKKERNFYDIWEDVKAELAKTLTPEEMEKVEEDISFFYTNLTLDGRFVNVGENKWNLRERLPFDKVHIDMNDVYADDEEEEIEENVDEEEEEDIEDIDESYDDSTGSDADISHYREVAGEDED